MPYSIGEQATWRTCPRCAAAVEAGVRQCPACGYATEGSVGAPPSPGQRPQWTPDQAVPAARPAIRPAAGGEEYDPLRLAIACIAAAIFGFAGFHLINIRSVGSLTGDGSIFEVFFQGVAFMAWGLAALSVAVGLRRV